MNIIMKQSMITLALVVLAACSSRPFIDVRPDNFLSVKAQYGTFLFGTYRVDTLQMVYLSFSGNEPDLLLSRVYSYGPISGDVRFFLIPLPPKIYSVRTIYFTEGLSAYWPDQPEIYTVSFSYQHGHGGSYGHWHHMGYGGFGGGLFNDYYYPDRIVSYPLSMDLSKAKIYYFGRVTLTNGAFTITNRFDEDKSLMLKAFESDTNALQGLMDSEYTNLLQ